MLQHDFKKQANAAGAVIVLVIFPSVKRVFSKKKVNVMNMLAPLVRRMFAIAYGENEFMLLEMKSLVWGTGQALLRSPRGRNASRDGLVKLGWVHCLQYTLNCFQYNVCDLCRCEPSNQKKRSSPTRRCQIILLVVFGI